MQTYLFITALILLFHGVVILSRVRSPSGLIAAMLCLVLALWGFCLWLKL